MIPKQSHSTKTPPANSNTDPVSTDPIGNDHSNLELYKFLEMRYGAGYAQDLIDRLTKFEKKSGSKKSVA